VTLYLTLVEVLDMHADQIRRYGGALGVRDVGLVEAAVFRPQIGHYQDLIQEASALWESLSQNHPFVDGNKRVAFVATATFLRLNGVAITADPDTVYEELMSLYEAGEFRFDNLEAWLRRNTGPLP